MTTLTRRSFLSGAAALGGSSAICSASFAQDSFRILRAAPAIAQIAPEGYPKTAVWSYATEDVGTVPGPEIRVVQGERVRYRLDNDLPQPTAVHWHGIRIDNAMDGAAPITQAPVPPGESFIYDFEAPDPGTYWYHSHNRSTEQVARGLAGPLIIEDRTAWQGLPGAASRELTLVLDDWLLNANAEIIEDRWDDLHAAGHAGRLGNTVTVNGRSYPDFAVQPGERLRLRIINTATARIMSLGLPGLSAQLIALDGHPVLPRDAEMLTIAPAQRADVVIDVPKVAGDRRFVLLNPGNGEWVDVATFLPEGRLVDAGETDVRPLPEWGSLRAPDFSNPQREALVMEGGAMRGIREGRYQGKAMGFRELMSNGMAWTFNGVAHGMDQPIFSTALDRTVLLEITNRTMFPHAIHLHGHHFTVQSRNGVSDAHRDIRDTVLIERDETVEIAFVADNPGRWMMHCHMLSHQAAGMMSWFEVT